MDSALRSLYWQGRLAAEPILMDGTSMMSFRSALMMNPSLSKQFTDAGFNTQTMSCMTKPYAAQGNGDFEPRIDISKQYGLSVHASLMIDL